MTDTEAHKAECLRKWEQCHPDAIHHAHLMNLRGIPGTMDRREYLAAVERKEGKDAADRLKQAYLKVCEERKAAK